MNGTYSVGMSVNANLRCYNFSEKVRSHSSAQFFRKRAFDSFFETRFNVRYALDVTDLDRIRREN
ncbi:hypothetical protein LEP1GSC005_3199 [Leptospira santarosai str. ST188]|nr:hypothetical protein LEP1GSC005_3199 [Leptospira santarosai str. ST188]EMO71789.1 hypothetical protein LEP1GSC130_0824 [Leptospira santarosai str. 200403458]EMO98965.1 hypothetical protein LEP1GSC120_1735 [Leptospira santarosai str. 200702252]